MVILSDQSCVLLFKVEHLMEDFGVLVSENMHVCVDFDILCCEPIDHALESFYFVFLLLLSSQDHIHLELHPIEVVHELCQTLA